MRMKKSLFFGCYIVITLVLSLLMYKQLRAQTLPAGALLIWPENPASEGVEWYSVAVYDGVRGQWVKVTDTSFCQSFEELRATYPAATLAGVEWPRACSHAFSISASDLGILGEVNVGTELCFNVVAAKTGAQASQPSDQICGVVEPIAGTTQPPIPDVLSAPGKGVLIFRN